MRVLSFATSGDQTERKKAKQGHAYWIWSVDFSPDGKRIVTTSLDNTAKIWDAESGDELLTLKGHSEAVSTVAFFPDGKRFVTGSWDGTIKFWDSDFEAVVK